jgi:hypothetical protein
MNLYEELDKFRSVIPEADHRGCGFHMYADGDHIKKLAMRTLSESVLPLSKNDLREDTKYTDNDTMFFFRSHERAQELMGYALGIGLAEGEVMLDPTIDPRWGVGSYAVRLMPHVRDTKPGALMAMFRKAQGHNAPSSEFYEWLEATGGALECDLEEMADVPRPETHSGTEHRYGMAQGDSVHSLTQQTGRGGGSDVHSVSHLSAAESIPSEPYYRQQAEAARATAAAARKNSGPQADLVNDGTNGTPMNGGGGAAQSNLGTGDPMEEYKAGDRELSEELEKLGVEAGLEGMLQLSGLMG